MGLSKVSSATSPFTTRYGRWLIRFLNFWGAFPAYVDADGALRATPAGVLVVKLALQLAAVATCTVVAAHAVTAAGGSLMSPAEGFTGFDVPVLLLNCVVGEVSGVAVFGLSLAKRGDFLDLYRDMDRLQWRLGPPDWAYLKRMNNRVLLSLFIVSMSFT